MYKLNMDLDAVASLEQFSLQMSQVANSIEKPRASEREDEELLDEIGLSSNVMRHTK